MFLELVRFSDKNDSTLGILVESLYDRKDFICFTLEDTYREEKITGETRVPCGVYPIELRDYGGHHERYKSKPYHKGMLEIKDVPKFKDVLIHIGNYIADTEGCILVGDGSRTNVRNTGSISESSKAYEHMYKHIIKAFDEGEKVFIKIIDYERIGL